MNVVVEPLGLPGLLVARGTRHSDHRGELRKVVTREALGRYGAHLPQDEVLMTHNPAERTLRGMHVQIAPSEQTKLLWVATGVLFDVLVDTRPDSPTYGQWEGLNLSGDDDLALLVPPGLAHGYLTLAPETSIVYVVGGAHSSAAARTLRWDDPKVGITWPAVPTTMSDADRNASGWPPR